MTRADGPRLAVATTALAGVILFLRRPDALLCPQLFAEDGLIFFVGAYFSGVRAMLMPYGGYLHLMPRLVAGLALGFDPRWTPAIYNYAAFALQLSVILGLFSPRVRLPAKPALALAFVFVPHTGEVLINLTNVQWSLALGLILLLIAEDATTAAQQAFDYAALVLCGLTGPFLVFLYPLVVIRWFDRRSRESTWLVFLAALIAGVQACYMYRDRALFNRPSPSDPLMMTSVMSGRVYGTFIGGYGLPNFPTSALWIGLGLGASGLLVYLVLRPGAWAFSRRMLGAALLCLCLAVAAKYLHEAVILSAPGNGDRYFFLPHVLLAWLLVMEGSRLAGWKRLWPATLLAVALAGNLKFYRVAPLKDYAWAQHLQPIREGKAFQIPINPEGFTMSGPAKVPLH